MKIEVTAEDIEHGEENSCLACPVALALLRTLGVQKGVVMVSPFHISLYRPGFCDRSQVSLLLPMEVSYFIDDVDRRNRRQPVSPITFEIPDEFAEKARQLSALYPEPSAAEVRA